ncbi:unnamed protein product [Brassica oleracea]|uniref:(rape) hypothetical protein n=1 Tax=Brassica napus TaxID=3708 RepID=A0A816V0L7_BRANA|nr:unnamed protein product [Brassica napus]
MLIQEKLKQGGLPKSSSVGMARIDEEGEAEEGSVNTKTKKVSDLYPCSKSYAERDRLLVICRDARRHIKQLRNN